MIKGIVTDTVLYEELIIMCGTEVEICAQTFSNLYPTDKFVKIKYMGRICYIEKPFIKLKR